MARSLATIWAFLVRDVTIALSYRLDFGLRVFTVVFQVLLFYFISQLIGSHPSLDQYGGYLPFSVVGLAVLSYFQTGFSSFAQAIRREQMMGTLESVLMTPTRISTVVIGSSVWSFVWATLIAILYLVCASLLYDIQLRGNLFLAVALLGLMILFFASLGVISASFIMVFKKGDPLSFLAGTLSALLGGAFIPVDILPSWLQRISYLIPLTYGLDGLRGILLKGEAFYAVLPECIVLLGFTCVFVPLSLFCFKKAVKRAQREGSLLQY